MKLHDWIQYRSYGDYTVVYDTKKGCKTIFEGIAYDILELLRDDITFDEIVHHIVKEYELTEEDCVAVADDVSLFISQISASGMIDDASGASLDLEEDSDKALVRICNEQHQLEHVYFELTYACNQKCVHCYEEHDKVSTDLSYQELCTILDELKDMGVLEVTFTGGEVATRKDFIALCAYASLLGFVVHIYTNGIGFTDEDIAQLCEMNIADISFSIYSIDPLVHDAITMIPGSLYRTMRTMFAFKSAGVRVIIKTVVMKQNNDGFKNVVDFAKIMHIPLETSMQILPTSPEDMRPIRYRLGDEEQYFKNMLYEATAFGYGINTNIFCKEKRTSVCGLGQCLNITPDGTVYPCNILNIGLGNLREQSVQEIWNSATLQNLRKFNVCHLDTKCQNCENLNYCLYCPGAVLRETGSMVTPASDTCSIARAKKRVYEFMSITKGETL